MGIIDRSKISTLLAPGLKKVFLDGYDSVEDRLGRFFNQNTSTKAYEEWAGMTSMGLAEVKPEGTGVTYKEITVLPTKRVYNVTIGLGTRATMEAMADEQYGMLKNLNKLIGKGIAEKIQIDLADMLFNYAFLASGVGYTGYDGLARFSTAHTLTGTAYSPSATDPSAAYSRSVTTCSNYLSAADLSTPMLMDMITMIRRQVDDMGNWKSFSPATLLVAPENEQIAWEILKSPKRTDTVYDVQNSLQRHGIEIFSDPHFLHTDATILSAPTSDTDLQFFDRMALEVKQQDDFDSGDLKTKGIRRYAMAFSNWRGAVGNPGA